MIKRLWLHPIYFYPNCYTDGYLFNLFNTLSIAVHLSVLYDSGYRAVDVIDSRSS